MTSSGEGSSVSMPYLKNLAGMKVDDESMKSVPHAQVELYSHVSIKTGQAGSIIGGLVGAAYGALKKRPVSGTLMNGARNGMLIGVPVGLIMTYMRMSSLSKNPDMDMNYAYYDRAYRLRNNRNQVRVDRSAMLGSLAGAAAGLASGNVLGRAAVGLALGTAAGGVYNSTLAKSN